MKVYVIAGEGRSKIGVSWEPERRVKELRSKAAGEALSVAATFAPPRADLVERCAHYLLREKRQAGEWFFVTADEAEAAVRQAIESVEAGWDGSQIAAASQRRYEAAKLDAGEHVQINVKLKTAADVEMIARLRERFPNDADPSIARRALRAMDESFVKVAGEKVIRSPKARK